MKKILTVFLFLLALLSFSSCDNKNNDVKFDKGNNVDSITFSANFMSGTKEVTIHKDDDIKDVAAKLENIVFNIDVEKVVTYKKEYERTRKYTNDYDYETMKLKSGTDKTLETTKIVDYSGCVSEYAFSYNNEKTVNGKKENEYYSLTSESKAISSDNEHFNQNLIDKFPSQLLHTIRYNFSDSNIGSGSYEMNSYNSQLYDKELLTLDRNIDLYTRYQNITYLISVDSKGIFPTRMEGYILEDYREISFELTDKYLIITDSIPFSQAIIRELAERPGGLTKELLDETAKDGSMYKIVRYVNYNKLTKSYNDGSYQLIYWMPMDYVTIEEVLKFKTSFTWENSNSYDYKDAQGKVYSAELFESVKTTISTSLYNEAKYKEFYNGVLK